MPMTPAVIAAIISAASTATVGGLQLAGVGQPSAPTATGPSAADQLKAKLAQQKQTAAMIANEAPNIEGATGGGVSPQYTAKVAATSQGVPFNPGDIDSDQLKALFGNMFGGSEGGGGTFA